MIIFVVCMVILGIYLQKEFWPKVPYGISKYRGLLMSAVLIVLFIILKLPFNVNFFSIFILLLILFGVLTFILDNR